MPHNARLYLVERILPENGGYNQGLAMLDIHMLIITGGKERTLSGYEFLLAQAGFVLDRVHNSTVGFSIMEARPR
jgi:hypothetical protein